MATIHIKAKNKGKFNALKKRTGKTTEQLTHSKNPLTRKRAIFAQNAKKWKHEYGGLVEFKDGGIYIKPANRGKFTAWANSHGKSVQGAASMILANKSKYSSTLVKRANFAKNASKWKHEEGGLVQYGLGGILGGITDIMNPLSAVTGVLGFGLDLIGKAKEKREERKAAEQERINTALASADASQSALTGTINPTFAFGGLIPNYPATIEAEGGEVIQGVDKSLGLVKGPKHSKGGVPLAMAQGGRVFSNKIINPETGRTFAEDADILRKQLR